MNTIKERKGNKASGQKEAYYQTKEASRQTSEFRKEDRKYFKCGEQGHSEKL